MTAAGASEEDKAFAPATIGAASTSMSVSRSLRFRGAREGTKRPAANLGSVWAAPARPFFNGLEQVWMATSQPSLAINDVRLTSDPEKYSCKLL